nr:polyketide synthase [Kordiimonas gwangyangensis]
MDPQQRLFLMEAMHALEEAGYAGTALDGQSVGLYVGTAESGYAGLLKDAGKLYTPQAFLGNAASILAARVSYMLNLRGPAIAVETACSSSLVAIHLACESLRRGETDVALAGGAYLLVTPQLYQLATSAGMLSPTGRCHAFGADADGFVPGEAVAVVVLKRLADAEADGDQILAVIAGSGINQDGRSNGMTAPNAHSQADLIRDVMSRYGINENSVGYVETHGTGTKLGDPIEVEGLNAAMRNGLPTRPVTSAP